MSRLRYQTGVLALSGVLAACAGEGPGSTGTDDESAGDNGGTDGGSADGDGDSAETTSGDGARPLSRGGILPFPEAEGDEPVSGVVGRESHLDAVTGNHADAETPHATRQLGRHRLTRLEGDEVATAAEDLLDGTGRLNEVVAGQTESSSCSGAAQSSRSAGAAHFG